MLRNFLVNSGIVVDFNVFSNSHQFLNRTHLHTVVDHSPVSAKICNTVTVKQFDYILFPWIYQHKHTSTRRPASADRTARRQFQDFNWWLLGKPVSDCMFAVIKIIKMELSGKTVYGSVLKITQLSACAQNHASPERGRKPLPPIFLGDHDFPLTGSNFGNLTAFRAIFSHIFTARAQERPFMNFRIKFWHHRSIPWSQFSYRARYFDDTRTFSVDFCIG